ncbi:type II toxin-antitoxin system Phd/YefM family antitoxin [candidate division CSSED10-310 bacterium]|uniref:Type II toxin-antitoxin system Phd/YefM family antitoxin n=1 Tax=candidate division CSSED10-310 bacterium TaxID=2855610 RepID=A0ABV6YWR0_UNCC1
MGRVTAKQLKLKTGEIMKRIRAGERLILTYRGKQIATIEPSISPVSEGGSQLNSDFEKAWNLIETKLKQTEPEFENWQEAIEWARKRN